MSWKESSSTAEVVPWPGPSCPASEPIRAIRARGRAVDGGLQVFGTDRVDHDVQAVGRGLGQLVGSGAAPRMTTAS